MFLIFNFSMRERRSQRRKRECIKKDEAQDKDVLRTWPSKGMQTIGTCTKQTRDQAKLGRK